jgi:hypothetical protein
MQIVKTLSKLFGRRFAFIVEPPLLGLNNDLITAKTAKYVQVVGTEQNSTTSGSTILPLLQREILQLLT